jgi:hypothetical protein
MISKKRIQRGLLSSSAMKPIRLALRNGPSTYRTMGVQSKTAFLRFHASKILMILTRSLRSARVKPFTFFEASNCRISTTPSQPKPKNTTSGSVRSRQSSLSGNEIHNRPFTMASSSGPSVTATTVSLSSVGEAQRLRYVDVGPLLIPLSYSRLVYLSALLRSV